MKQEILNLEYLLGLPYIEPDFGFDISEDGSKIAFSWNKPGRWEVYILDVHAAIQNQESLQPRQITCGEGAKFSPRWRPHRNQLAYILDLDGSENYDIYLFDFEINQHSNLTPRTFYAISPMYAWSPDGNSIAFCADKDGCFDTYILSIHDGSMRKVLDHSFVDWEVTWSRCGKYLAVVSETIAQDTWITIVPVDGGSPSVISFNGEPINAKDPCWSPDDKQLAFASNLGGNYQIGVFHIESGEISWITSGEGEKEHPDWSPSGELTYVISRGPDCRLAVQKLTSVGVKTYQIAPGVIYSPKFLPDDSQLCFSFDNPQYPCDIWSLSVQDEEFHQITRSLPGNIALDKFVMPVEVTYPGMDGIDVPGLLYCSQTREIAHSHNLNTQTPKLPPPGIIYIHGGPNWLTQITWDPLVQHIVSRGWVVLAPNYRGSTGHGKKWQLANRFDLGGVDTEDVVAGAKYLIAEKIADRDRIAITGRSWGGYLTMTSLTQFPDFWAAGSAVVPFLNWFTAHKNSREDLQHWDLQNFGDPVRNKELWYQRSPYFFLDRIQSPVQLICGANDVRCPASESLEAYRRLCELGKVCEYVLYEDEGHSFLKKENLVKSKIQQVEFLSKYLEI